MRPWTESLPKPLIPVSGRPFADLQLQLLADQGISDVVYSAGYRASQLQSFIGDGARWGLSVRYVVEDEHQLLGTAGALRLAADQGALAERFFILYGDSYLPIELPPVCDAYTARGLPALMTVLRNDGRWDRSNVEFRDGLVVHYDKDAPTPDMRFIDYGLSIMSRKLVEDNVPPDGTADLGRLFHQLSGSSFLAGFEVHQRFYEVGSLQGLRDLEEYLSDRARQA
jgi:NDP-sugar pyrophosphorylase family protein